MYKLLLVAAIIGGTWGFAYAGDNSDYSSKNRIYCCGLGSPDGLDIQIQARPEHLGDNPPCPNCGMSQPQQVYPNGPPCSWSDPTGEGLICEDVPHNTGVVPPWLRPPFPPPPSVGTDQSPKEDWPIDSPKSSARCPNCLVPNIENRALTENLQPGDYQVYPDPVRTPGSVNPDITQDNINETICAHNGTWSTKDVRPSVKYTNRLKRKQIGEYGYTDRNPRHYEEDHMIPLTIGGNPTDPENLWPEAWRTTPHAGNKDTVEVYLNKQVCDGKMQLREAQQAIVDDWVAIYNKLKEEGYQNPWHNKSHQSVD